MTGVACRGYRWLAVAALQAARGWGKHSLFVQLVWVHMRPDGQRDHRCSSSGEWEKRASTERGVCEPLRAWCPSTRGCVNSNHPHLNECNIICWFRCTTLLRLFCFMTNRLLRRLRSKISPINSTLFASIGAKCVKTIVTPRYHMTQHDMPQYNAVMELSIRVTADN